MVAYTRQSTISDGDTITAALFNNEYNQLLSAFSYASSGTTGHKHDGTAGEGGHVPQIGDQDFLNKIVTDSTNNRFGIFVQVSSSAVEQIRIQDGAIVPVTDNDIDLGTSSVEFKDAYFDGTVTTDALVADTADINGGTVDGATIGASSATTIVGTTITANTAFVPDASDGAALGTSSLEFSDLFLADGAVINFGDDQDVTLTHVADTGLLLNSTMQLQFNDSSQYINAPSATVLDINATDEIELNATLVDINANVEVSGTLTVAGAVDFGDAALSNVGAVQLDSIAGDGDTNTSITFSGSDVITIATGGTTAMTLDASQNVTIAGDLTITGDDLTMGTNTSGMLLIADGTNFNPTAVTSLSEISTVANDDVFLAIDTSGGGLKKIARSAVVSGLATSSAISNVVEDTSPQLGGNLDTNSHNILIDDAHFIADENGNEQIIFQTTSSAVNQIDVTNAATGNAPEIAATGGDTNVSLKLTPKGSGQVLIDGNVGIETGLIDLKNGGSQSAVRLYCESSNAHYAAIQAPAHSDFSGNVTLTLPATTDTLAGIGATQTLTNKTLTSPVLNTATVGTSIVPSSADGATLGTASAEFSDLFLADGSIIKFGNDQDVTLTHVADTGVTLSAGNNDTTLQLDGNASDAGSGPKIILNRTSDSPADDDYSGAIIWNAENDNNQQFKAAQISVQSTDVSDGTEDSQIQLATIVNGTETNALILENSGIKLPNDSTVLGFGADNEVTLTHVHDTGLLLADSGGTPTLQFHDSNEAVSSDGSNLKLTSGGTTFTIPSSDGSNGQALGTNGSGVLSFVNVSSAADDISTGDAAVTLATSAGNITIDAQGNDTDIILKGTDGSSDTTFLTIDGSDAGTASFNHDVKLANDAAILGFGADNDVTLTHVADTGLLLNSTMQLQFNDASQNINAPSATVLDINATDEIELNATLADVNANLDVSGTYTGGGTMTTGGNIVIPDAGNIGSASDTDAMAIASTGQVTFSQNINPPHPAKNYLINGDFAVSQRLSGAVATSATTPANNDDTYIHDRWLLLSDGNDIADVGRSVANRTDMRYIGYNAVETADKKFGFAQIIEAQDAAQLVGGSAVVTLSFIAAVSNTTRLDDIRAGIVSWSGTGDSVTSDLVSNWNGADANPTLASNWTFENTPANLSVGGSFAKYSVTATIDTSSTTNVAAFIWSNSVDNDVDDIWYLGGCQLELGSYPTPFITESFDITLAKCQRYFNRIPVGTGSYKYSHLIAAGSSGGTYLRNETSYPVTMRSTTQTNTQTGAGSSGSLVGVAAGHSTENYVVWQTNVTGAGHYAYFTNGILTNDCEL